MPLLVTTPNCTGVSGNPCQNSTSNSNFSIDLFYDPVANSGSIANGGLTVNVAQDAVTISHLGVWALYTVSVTASGGAGGKDIVIQLRSDTTSIAQPHQVDFDIASATPLPAAVWMFGSVVGLGGAVGLRQQRKSWPNNRLALPVSRSRDRREAVSFFVGDGFQPLWRRRRPLSVLYRGRVIFSGRTRRSNSSPLTKPSRTASSRSVVPFACAVLAIFAALS